MIKKLFITAAAAAAVSVPLAGAAWAEPPSDPGSTDTSTDTGIGSGGMPGKLGTFLKHGIVDANGDGFGDGSPTTPGSIISGQAKADGNTPDAMRDFEAGIWSNYRLVRPDPLEPETITSVPGDWEGVTPGLAIKPLTPGCDHGRSAVPSSVSTSCVG